MFQPPDHYHNLSLRLSEVFANIGITEELVRKERRSKMLDETMGNIHNSLDDNRSLIIFYFGSQTQVSTTSGLNSDHDSLHCYRLCNIIQYWTEWEAGKWQFLMIQDETTSHEYCLLQLVRDDIPLPQQGPQNEIYSIDDRGRVLLRHSLCLTLMQTDERCIRHGPAVTTEGMLDTVQAIHCLSWPKEAELWLQQENAAGWPTADMKRYSAENGCFVVPVGSRTGMYGDLEWRISTSLAERCLMFSLNMTQLRCYILMKMIIKCYIKPQCEEAISSFMCKNVSFHCIASSRPNQWSECNLITCLNQCLQHLFYCILTDDCPHFMIPRNNLLAGKLSIAVKQKLVGIMFTLTSNIEHTLLGITLDDLGSHVVNSCSIFEVLIQMGMDFGRLCEFSWENKRILISSLCLSNKISENISNTGESCFYQSLVKKVFKLCQLYLVGNNIEQKVCRLVTPILCSNISSVMASADIHQYHSLSQQTLQWFSVGLNSDFSFCRLKLASALYCVGDLERCEVVLVGLERQFTANPVFILCCCANRTYDCFSGFVRYVISALNEDNILIHKMSFFVRYFPCEVNCIPNEQKFELFRSTVDDLPYRTENDNWMDCAAVVDSLPYLYFLQYKVYSQLGRPVDQYRALDNLAMIIGTKPNLGHPETALNLLGQCMEQENRKQDALRCFTLSLNVRGRNNAAKWHICRLLSGLFS